MEGCVTLQKITSPVNLHWFFSKSKVSICLAITDLGPLVRRLTEERILSEEEWLELLGDTRPVHRVVYECLCWIEEKKTPLESFFEHLFCKPFLLKYPNLKPVFKEYKKEKSRNGINFPADKENQDKDLTIFTQEKVKISLAITELFPFLHGLQDLTFLSETESLKLHADGRPVSRVIYECLSLIERKNLKLNVVFEYIFQECYQTLYPGLRLILQESTMEQPGPFHGMQSPTFTSQEKLLELYEQIKPDIAAAITERFPFLHGLRDAGLLPKIEFLRLQAQKGKNKDVLCRALGLVYRQADIEALLSYTFREHYLAYYPDLKSILTRINKALTLDRNPPTPGIKKALKLDRNPHTPAKNSPRIKADWRSSQIPSPHIPDASFSSVGSEDTDAHYKYSYMRKKRRPRDFIDVNGIVDYQVRSCRTKPVCYTEVSEEQDWEANQKSPGKRRSSFRMLEEMRHKRPRLHSPDDSDDVSAIKQRCIQAASELVVRLEFPKEVFDDEFPVWCGHKAGIFMRNYWTGDPRHDECIKCNNKMFTVIEFEKYGGRAASKAWKNSIRSAGWITLNTLFQFLVLKSPSNLRDRVTSGFSSSEDSDLPMPPCHNTDSMT